MSGFAMSMQIRCHQAAWKAEEQEISICGRFSQQEPMGFSCVHGRGLNTWWQAQDAHLQWLSHLLQGTGMFSFTILQATETNISVNRYEHIIISGIQCNNRFLLVTTACGVQQRQPHNPPCGVSDHKGRQNWEACQCLEGCWHHCLQFLLVVEEAEGWHEDEGDVSTILSFLLNRDHAVSVACQNSYEN